KSRFSAQFDKEQKKLHQQLLQAQKMESIGRLAGGIAHDFNNMMGIILGHTEMMQNSGDLNQQKQGFLEEIKIAATRSAELTKQLLAFAREQPVSPQVIDLNKSVESTISMLTRLFTENITLSWLPGQDSPFVFIDPSQIGQILANLCLNAQDAIADIGTITIETETLILDDRNKHSHPGSSPVEYVLLTVSDTGSGMDEDTLSNAFEPFYTTKEMGTGTGLGLSMVHGIIKQNGGHINLFSEKGSGTVIKIYLPRYGRTIDQSHDTAQPERTAQEIEKTLSNETANASETILLVEDEPAILQMTTLILESLGYTVLAAGHPEEAFRLAGENSREIELLITDVIMPEMNGRDLSAELLKLYPDLKCLFMSGYTADLITNQGVLERCNNFIQKPFRMKDLEEKVREILDRV
ncbi:ATP-binding protein, partial [Oceanispirochaeta sp.]|uniref:ATP-binding protein n=1 Tax=Oceanispirochaeta sp. TaxID=2035350 RepID=UPI00263378A3